MLTRVLARALAPESGSSASLPGAWPSSPSRRSVVRPKPRSAGSARRTTLRGAILYLVGAEFVTGTSIVVDGGSSAPIRPVLRLVVGSMDVALRIPLPQPARTASIPRVTFDSTSDGELLSRVGTGDRAAFEELYRRFARPVLGLALRRLAIVAAPRTRRRKRSPRSGGRHEASTRRAARAHPGSTPSRATLSSTACDELRSPLPRLRTPRPTRPARPSKPRRGGSRGGCIARSRCCPTTSGR